MLLKYIFLLILDVNVDPWCKETQFEWSENFMVFSYAKRITYWKKKLLLLDSFSTVCHCWKHHCNYIPQHRLQCLSNEIQKWNRDVITCHCRIHLPKPHLFLNTINLLGKNQDVLIRCLIHCFLNLWAELIPFLSSHDLLLACSVWRVF